MRLMHFGIKSAELALMSQINLTKKISRQELACKCGCGFDSCDYETIQVGKLPVIFLKKMNIEKVNKLHELD